MKLPQIDIAHANIWQSPPVPQESKPRFVTHYEVEIRRSAASPCSLDGQRTEMKPGMILFARPGQIRHSRLPFCNGFIYFDCLPHREWDALLARIPDFSPPDERRTALFTRLIEAFPHDPLLAAALLIELLFSLAEGRQAPPIRPTRQGQAEIFRAICYMKQNLDKSLRVSQMAAQAGYSPAHFTARFRELTGTSPYEYFSRLRLNEAKRLLLCEGKSIGDTADLLGFASASHFCQRFHQRFHVTPGEFLQSGFLTGYEAE